MMRLKVRPKRNERKAMIFSSQRLPRSRCLTHSAAMLGPSTRFASLRFTFLRFTSLRFIERAAGHFALVDANRKVNQSSSGGFVFQNESFARPNRLEKLRGADAPASKINSARNFDGPEHLIQQYGARQHRECGEVARKGRVVRRDVERAVHFHCDSFIRPDDRRSFAAPVEAACRCRCAAAPRQ